MCDAPGLPVAQYLRVSTGQQKYSLLNQALTIQAYAQRHGFRVVETYTDVRRSGVVIQKRLELIRLLRDVISGDAVYRAVLVYDVSRWGRFQDCDEAAHYEFVCRSAGVPVHYCAENFPNNVWNRCTRRLGGPCLPNPRSEWLVKPGAFEPVVDPQIFQEAQAVLARRTCSNSNEQILDDLRHLLAVHGKLTGALLDRSPGVPSSVGCRRRFGGLRRAFELAGYSRHGGKLAG